MRFEKWQALGNDYAIVERDAVPWELTAERVARLCGHHFGIGADGVLVLSRPSQGECAVQTLLEALQPPSMLIVPRGRVRRERLLANSSSFGAPVTPLELIDEHQDRLVQRRHILVHVRWLRRPFHRSDRP